LRASIEIVPDRGCKRAAATLIAERDYQSDDLAQVMMKRASDEAKKYGLDRIDVVAMTGEPQTIRTQMARFG
jgi:hypothetical protein